MSLKEDTVSADRKERIIFDPEAWKKSDKSGRKTSAITSRQNFDNEKFTRNEKEKVDEGTIQVSGDSKVDSAGPSQSDTISDKKVKKSNNPQIEFVTGTAQPNGSSSTAIGGAQATGRKIAEALVKKALTQVKTDKNVGTEEIPFDGPYTKTPSDVVDKSGAHHTPMSRARTLARQALAKQVKKEGWDPEQFGSDGSGAGRPGGAGGGDIGKTDKKKKFKSLAKEEVILDETCADDKKKKVVKKEETDMSDKKTYAQFVAEMNFDSNGVYRHKGTYGNAGKGAKYGETDYDNENLDKSDDEEGTSAPAAKKGRGRPSGSYGTYKARSAETKAAAAAKSAATKAANKAK